MLQQKETQVTNSVKSLLQKENHSLKEVDIVAHFNRYNLENFIAKAGCLSNDLFYNNDKSSPAHISESIKHALDIEGFYHQHGIAYMVNIALLSKGNDHKLQEHSIVDFVYLCNIYDNKIVELIPDSEEDLDRCILRFNYEQHRYVLGSLTNLIGRSLVIYSEILEKRHEELSDVFEEEFGMELQTYFKVAIAILSVAKHNNSQVIKKNVIGKIPHLDSILSEENVTRFINYFSTDYKGFRRIDEEINVRYKAPITKTRLNPLYPKPLITSQRKRVWLPSVPIFIDAVFNGLLSFFSLRIKEFRGDYFGPAFEKYVGTLLEDSYEKVVPEIDYDGENNLFYDYSVILDDVIYFIEVKSHSENIQFKQSGDLSQANPPNETVGKQIKKIDLLKNSNYKARFDEELGIGWESKKHLQVFIFNDVNRISNTAFQRSYFSDSAVKLIEEYNVKFLNIKDFEQFLAVIEKINLEDYLDCLNSSEPIKVLAQKIPELPYLDVRNPYLLKKFDEFCKWTKKLNSDQPSN